MPIPAETEPPASDPDEPVERQDPASDPGPPANPEIDEDKLEKAEEEASKELW